MIDNADYLRNNSFFVKKYVFKFFMAFYFVLLMIRDKKETMYKKDNVDNDFKTN